MSGITTSELRPTVVAQVRPSTTGSAPSKRWAALWSSAPVLAGELRTHYCVRAHRIELLLTSLVLSFVGGAAMFGFHALYRGETGPQISHGSHWLMDSTLGFLALTPVLALLLPLSRRLVARTWLRPVLVGLLFALVTAPGPLVHDLLVGGGTTLAHAAELVFGQHEHESSATSVATAATHSALSKVLGQLAVGGPVYILLTSLVALALRGGRIPVSRFRAGLIPRPRPAF